MNDTRTVPLYSDEAEESVLGAVMLAEPTLYGLVVEEGLMPEHFYRAKHGEVYQAMLDLHSEHREIDVLTVTEALRAAGTLDRVGGPSAIDALAGAAPAAGNAREYARIVRDRSQRRQLREASRRIDDIAVNGRGDTRALVDAAQQTLSTVGADDRKRSARHISDILMTTLDTIDQRARSGDGIFGVRSGFPSLDESLGGFQPGRLYVVAARPSMGKSSFALDIAHNAAFVQREPALVFSLEMSDEEVSAGLLAREAGMPTDQLQRGLFHQDRWPAINAAAARLSESPLWVDDSNATLFEMRAKARQRASRDGGLALIVVDYLQLISADGRHQNRTEEVSAFSRGLKQLARELSVPVIALSQLSRRLEDRLDKRPLLSDLRESGQIEADADVVLMLYRDGYYRNESEHPNRAEVIVRKNRQTGRRQTILLDFEYRRSRYRDDGLQSPA